MGCGAYEGDGGAGRRQPDDRAARLNAWPTELAADPDAGLIQSFPHADRGGDSSLPACSSFPTSPMGGLLAEGLARFGHRHEGNYWGHNAIIRTRAFAASGRPAASD